MNDRKTGKWIISISLCILISGCTWNPPEGYTEKHHSYEELVEYARSIDPDATVSDDPEDVKDDYWEYRIYPAVINGMECSVASTSDVVYDSLGEFGKIYYKMDTDYDYYIISDVLNDYPELGTIYDDSESMRFQVNDVIVSGIEVDSITQDELDELWDAYKRINSELEQYDLRKTFWLKIAFPDGDSYFKETSEQYYQDKIGRLKESGKL